MKMPLIICLLSPSSALNFTPALLCNAYGRDNITQPHVFTKCSSREDIQCCTVGKEEPNYPFTRLTTISVSLDEQCDVCGHSTLLSWFQYFSL